MCVLTRLIKEKIAKNLKKVRQTLLYIKTCKNNTKVWENFKKGKSQ